MKKLKKVLIGIVAVVVFIGLGGLFFASRGLDEGKQVTINEVDLSKFDDGVYSGDYHHGRWANQVEIRLENHEIVEIKHIEGFNHKEAMETIHERVLEDQSLLVDVVSGATVSSKAYLKAIENALMKNPDQ